MLRLTEPAPGWRMNAAVMSDLGMIRYEGYAALPEAAALKRRLLEEQPAQLEHGVHLIVVQSADGSLVVGDSHHYDATPDPFGLDGVDALILEEFEAVFALSRPPAVERWIGTYSSAPDRPMFMDRPADAVRLVMITSGTGASTSFAIAEETLADLFG
jgi:glycine/D-amino acid oxidase-like deaminating enzyme